MNGSQQRALQAVATSSRQVVRKVIVIFLATLGVITLVASWLDPSAAFVSGWLTALAAAAFGITWFVREKQLRALPSRAPDVVWVFAGRTNFQVGDELLARPDAPAVVSSRSICLGLRDGDLRAFLVRGADTPTLMKDLSQAFPAATIGFSDPRLEQFVASPASLERQLQ